MGFNQAWKSHMEYLTFNQSTDAGRSEDVYANNSYDVLDINQFF